MTDNLFEVLFDDDLSVEAVETPPKINKSKLVMTCDELGIPVVKDENMSCWDACP